MGRPPKPTNLKLLHGESRPSQVNYNEPKPRLKAPAAPVVLSGRALEVWRDTTAELQHMGLLAAADAAALAVYCQAVARYEQAVEYVNANGMMVVGRGGEMVKNPAMQFERDQAVLVKVMAVQFGLTPAARAGLSTGEPEEPGGAERLLS